VALGDRGGGGAAVKAWMAFVGAVALAAGVASAHPASIAGAVVDVASGGETTLRMRFDVPAFALNETPARIGDGAMRELLTGPVAELERLLADAGMRFVTLTGLEADGVAVPLTLGAFPTSAEVRAAAGDGTAARLPIRLELAAAGRVPAGAGVVTISFPAVLGDVVVTFETPGAEATVFSLRDGERSPEVRLGLLAGVAASTASDREPERAVGGGAARGGETASWARTAWGFVGMGVVHIVPRGPDHVLFVLGLFLLTPAWRPLLGQVTAFTVAHSISLALAHLGVIRPPAAVVEPLIAASIVMVGVENVLGRGGPRRWRPALVFALGLVHGLGFAGVLGELSLPAGMTSAALVGFNVGVEAGQLAVLGGAFALLGPWRERPWYRARIVVPASLLIAAVGAVWTVQRIAG